MSPRSLEDFDPSRWAEVESVLDVALELQPDERAAYVDRACKGNDALRRDVLALLDADTNASSFLSIPVSPLRLTQGDIGDATETAGTPQETQVDLEPPARIGRYVVEQEIGRGGMGVVYMGTDPVQHRSVAIKALGNGRSDEPEHLADVLREAKLLAWLQHPNVAPIYGIERENGVPYLVMERVEGQSLAQRLEQGPLSIVETLDVGLQIAEALSAAHALGIVHRDVKPGNVMITPGGLAKVLDFGVARYLAPAPATPARAQHGVNAPGAPTSQWGTPGYMSPEQILGLENDARGDAFAFGCILYECLTGVSPFARASALATFSSTLRGDVDWRRLPRDTPEPLREAVVSLLRRDPEDRPGDMRRIAGDLAKLLETLGGRPSVPRTGASTARLPATSLELIGRDREREAVERLLEHSRIVTLTGPPGVGKTRLGIEVARGWDASHPGDLWFVDLSSARDESDVAVALRGALGSGASEDPTRGLAGTLKERPGLLVLDDAASAAGAVLDAARSALEACPGLRILTTSRERLGIDGEQTFRVPPLLVPDPEVHRSGESIAACASIALLIAAAEGARPGFRIDRENADAAARIARAVDGLPLALELAGAMLREDAVDVVAARLEQAASDGSARGDHLDALLRLSHAGLLDDERRLFADLSLFAGGWTLESAVAVCGTDGDAFSMLDLLSRLVEKSFVVIERGDRVEPRYRYLEPIRSFAVRERESAESSSERCDRYVQYFASLSERLSSDLSEGRTDLRSLAIFQAEHANIVEAIRRCEQRGDATGGVRLAGNLWRFWSIRGMYTQGRRMLQRALELPGASPAARARALFGAGVMACYQGDFAVAEDLNREAMEIYTTLEDRVGYGHGLILLGTTANELGRTEQACGVLREAAQLFRGLGDQWRLTMALNNLGVIEREQENYAAALQTYEETLEQARGWGERESLAVTLINLSLVTMRLDLLDRARGHLLEAIALVHELRWKRMAVSALDVAGELLTRLGQPAPAVELFGSADELRGSIGNPPGPWWAKWRDRVLGELTDLLGDVEFRAHWALGQGHTMDEALGQARALLAADTAAG